MGCHVITAIPVVGETAPEIWFWSPDYRNDLINLEGVQKIFTKILQRPEGISNKKRLDKLGQFFKSKGG